MFLKWKYLEMQAYSEHSSMAKFNQQKNSNRMIYSLLRSLEKKICKKVLTSLITWVWDISPAKIHLSINKGTFAPSFMLLPQLEVFFCYQTLLFDSFYSEYFPDNQIDKIIENDILEVSTYCLSLDNLYITHSVNL